jgi:hypothetical protein
MMTILGQEKLKRYEIMVSWLEQVLDDEYELDYDMLYDELLECICDDFFDR